jgi:hypothetical protein
MVKEAVADGDYSKAIGKEIVLRVNALVAAAGRTPTPPPATAAPTPGPNGLLSSEEEAKELWSEVQAGNLPLEDVDAVCWGLSERYTLVVTDGPTQRTPL